MVYKLHLISEVYKSDNIKFGRLEGSAAPRIVVK
jgi:hypothetical protein